MDGYQKKVKEIVEKFGFDWSDYAQYIHLTEEIGELGEALTVRKGDRQAGKGTEAMADHSDLEEEFGDVLFNLIELSNKLGISLDKSLQDTFFRYKKKLAALKNR